MVVGFRKGYYTSEKGQADDDDGNNMCLCRTAKDG
jgi:hypothetical protein